ncbi:MAG: protein kinase [Hydrogenophaga sp.]|uniref:protein kinase domain-containing protein n=1 Tax=Hydrogenophaga sp. TaxID=1904254 RepID=UPI001DE3DA75|nr:protein kinase [Hydrogenophaga sp.]MBX3609955.1 protein kinase [Hydrogenophaga sp.]
MQRINIYSATVGDLQSLAMKAGRIRLKNNELYVRPHRSGNLVNRAVESLVGLTTTKRQVLLTAMQSICARQGVNFDAAMKDGLGKDAWARVESGKGDLKADHISKALDRFTQLSDNRVIEIGDVIGKGGAGRVKRARFHNDGQTYALKEVLENKCDAPGLKEKRLEVQRREVVAHQIAARTRIPGCEVSYVVDTQGLVNYVPTGDTYQVMSLGLASGDMGINKDKMAALNSEINRTNASLVQRGEDVLDEAGRRRIKEAGVKPGFDVFAAHCADPTSKLSVLDWTNGLRQIHLAGIAHRDIKPENYLLSSKGVWQLTDFGVAGAENSRFYSAAEEITPYATGNGNDWQKAPEWLVSESKQGSGYYEVGHKADVFSLGVAVFRHLTGGRLPFEGPPEIWSSTVHTAHYVDRVISYANSDLNLTFSDWYKQDTDVEIPKEWQNFFNMTLCPDPAQRASAEQLAQLEIFQGLQANESDLRNELLTRAGH